jgi:dolichol-phosphate mannosyltransferase
MEYKDLTVIIPTLNEEKNISKLVGMIMWLYPGVSVTVSDDGSKDETRDLAKKAGARALDRTNKPIKGLCVSVMDAVKICKTKYFIVIDGDFQHPPEKIKDMYKELKKNQVVVGKRLKVMNDWPWHRKLMSKTAIAMGNFRLRKKEFKCSDVMSGFFGMQTRLFNEIVNQYEDRFEKTGYKVLFDALKYAPKNTKLAESGYEFGLREGGESKIGLKHILVYFRSIFK